MSVEDFKKLNSALGDRELSFNDSSEYITVSCTSEDDLKTLEAELVVFSITTQPLAANKLEFSVYGFPFELFWDLKNFRERAFAQDKSTLDSSFSKDFAVLNGIETVFNGNRVFHEIATKKTFVDFNEREQSYFFSNSECYLRFLQFLKEKEHKEDNHFHFVDLFSWETRSFTFVSATKEGKLSVSFDNFIPDLSDTEDLCKRFNRLYEAFDETDKKQKLPKFIKAELLGILAKEPKGKRLGVFIDKLEQVLDVAEQNFDIYLYDLSLENLKKDYLESKDKYFAQLREILGKITTQIIGLPVSISAVALATYSIPAGENKNTVLFILIIAFAVYSIFATFLLKLYKEDLDDMEHQYNRDFSNLENSAFFQKYESEKEHFDQVKWRVCRKIVTMRGTVLVYFGVMTITNCVLVWKLLVDASFNPWWTAVFFLVQVIAYFIFYSEIIRKKTTGNESKS